MWLTDSQKIGVGLTASGIFFMLLGVIMFFDGGLLAIGNILFLSGVTLVIGFRKTIVFFGRKQKIRGTVCFFLGIFLVFMRWPVIGILVEGFGFLNLFGDFFPVVISFLRRFPIIGSVLNLPVISADLDDQQLLETIDSLSENYDPFEIKTTPDIRRSLYANVDSVYAKVADEFKEMTVIYYKPKFNSESRESIESLLQNLNQLGSKLKDKSLISQINSLEHQKYPSTDNRLKIKNRKTLVDLFLEKFMLNETELAFLSSSRTVNTEFFSIFKKIQHISDDCKALLVIDGQTVGTEILERMNALQEAAFDRLARWLMAELRSISMKKEPEPTLEIKEALKLIKQRPHLSSNCIDELVAARNEFHLKHFVIALNRSTSESEIDTDSEPQVYVEEMCTWITNTVEQERLFLDGLFEYKESVAHRRKSSAVPSVQRRMSMITSAFETMTESHQDPVQSIEALIKQTLVSSVEFISRPLKLRVEQILMNQTDPRILLGINNQLSSCLTFLKQGKLLSAGSVLECLNELVAISDRLVKEILNTQASLLLRDNQFYSFELDSFKPMINQMSELLIYEGSENLLELTLDPILQKLSFNASKFTDKLEQAVYMMNGLQLIIDKCSEIEHLSAVWDRIQEQMDTFKHLLESEQLRVLLSASGMNVLVSALDQQSLNHLPLSRLVDESSVTQAMYQLHEFKQIPHLNHQLSVLQHLNAIENVVTIRSEAIQMFIESYARIHQAVLDPKNKYEFPSVLLKISVEQLQDLLN